MHNRRCFRESRISSGRRKAGGLQTARPESVQARLRLAGTESHSLVKALAQNGCDKLPCLLVLIVCFLRLYVIAEQRFQDTMLLQSAPEYETYAIERLDMASSKVPAPFVDWLMARLSS